MSAPQGDGLERRLTELLEQRAATVTRARPLDLGSSQGARGMGGQRPGRRGGHWRKLGVLAAAAALFVVVAGTILGIQQWHDRRDSQVTPAARPARLSCAPSEAPASWLRAIGAGTFKVDRELNSVISADGGTGDYLTLQGKIPPTSC